MRKQAKRWRITVLGLKKVNTRFKPRTRDEKTYSGANVDLVMSTELI